jgi:ribosome-binding protein aMBF1 (putative translation factor)
LFPSERNLMLSTGQPEAGIERRSIMSDPVSARTEATRAEYYGARLRAEAERQGLNGLELARRMGVNESAVSRWYSGERNIAVENQIAAARVLGVPLLSLFPPMTREGELVA